VQSFFSKVIQIVPLLSGVLVAESFFPNQTNSTGSLQVTFLWVASGYLSFLVKANLFFVKITPASEKVSVVVMTAEAYYGLGLTAPFHQSCTAIDPRVVLKIAVS
jgi:hypothetical protein